MKTRNFVVMALTVLIAAALQLPAQKSKPVPAKNGQAIQIAPQVAAVFDADVPARKNRSDIPMNYLRTFYLPAQQNQVYPVFLFQVKNADLNFTPAAETPGLLKANHFTFARIYRLENGVIGEIARETFIRFDLEEKQETFQPEAMNYYSIAGNIYPAGTYLLALAVTTPDYSRISTSYTEFTLPDFAAIKDKLVTTPVFSVTSLQMMQAAETKLVIHKNSFVFNTLVLSPDLKNEFKANENLDLFYFIMGSKPNDTTGSVDLQITYTFKRDGKEVNKLTPQTVASPIISQPIDFTFTEITKNAKGVETQRQEKLLEPGDYVLEIDILDKASQVKGSQEFKFKII